MKIIVIAIIGIFLVAFASRKVFPGTSKEQNITISNISFEPPVGSVLKAHTPVVVSFDYSYTRPNENLHVWVKVVDESLESTYEGSMDSMTPGSDSVSRYFYLTDPGKVSSVYVVMKNQDYEEVFRKTLDVDFVFQKNVEMDAFNEDGAGSKITAISFDVGHPAVLKAGSKINVNIEYEIDTEIGLDIWVIPETDCNMSYEGTTGKQSGSGLVSKYFIVSEPCQINRLKFVMANAANKTVYSKYVDVDFTYE